MSTLMDNKSKKKKGENPTRPRPGNNTSFERRAGYNLIWIASYVKSRSGPVKGSISVVTRGSP